MRKRPLLLAASVFLLGILYSYKNLSVSVILLVLLLSYDVIFLLKKVKIKKIIGREILLLFIFYFSVLHVQEEIRFRNTYLQKLSEGDSVTLLGEIYKTEPSKLGSRVYLRDCSIRLKGDCIPCNYVMVYSPSSKFQIGEVYQIKGEFHQFQSSRNEGNFSAILFYKSQKIDFYLNAKEVKFIEDRASFWEKKSLAFKEHAARVFEKEMDPSSAGVLKSIVLGDKSGLDEELKTLYVKNAIVHILAVSGLHVSIVGRRFYQFLRKRRFSFLLAGILAALLLFAYGFLTGNGVSAQRAIGMLYLYMLAQYVGKSYDMLNALAGVCLLLLWMNPFFVDYTGFVFSVSSILGIGWVGQALMKDVKKGAALWMSIGISITTLPVVLSSYYEFNPYGFLVNFFVIPMMAPLFILALFAAVIGIRFPFLAKLPLALCHLILELIEVLCQLVQKFPCSNMITGEPSKFRIVIYYIGIILFLLIAERRKLSFYHKTLPIIAMVIFLIVPIKSEFEISFLDVGQGDGIYIHMDQCNFFIDGGSVDIKHVGQHRMLPFLKHRGVGEIDYWFISHLDRDHISGVIELMESEIKIQHFVLAKGIVKDDKYYAFIELAKEHKIPLVYMKKGDVLKTRKGKMNCMYAGEPGVNDKNDACLVIKLEYGGFQALFQGDISDRVEQELVKEQSMQDIFLYKAAHHGSKSSNCQEMLEETMPNVIVVSCGEKNVYGHPAKEAVERMKKTKANLYYTMKQGQIKINLKKGRVKITPFLREYMLEEFE